MNINPLLKAIKYKYYAGIGSRKTPKEILLREQRIAEKLRDKGYGLRSGHAKGADQAFERGSIGGNNEVIKPSKNFEWQSDLPGYNKYINYDENLEDDKLYKEILQQILTERHYKNLMNSNPYVQKLILRDMQQILGDPQGTNPSKFVLYSAPQKGEDVLGGTGYATKLAKERGIPTFNLMNNDGSFNKKSLYDLIEMFPDIKGDTK